MRNTRGFVLVISLVFAFFLTRVLYLNNWDALALVLLTPADASPGQTTNIGYDGRFSYHIAVNAFGNTEGLDEPNFRYQRILFPLVVKALSFGNKVWVPWLMLGLNLVFTGLNANLLSRLMQKHGTNPWWGITLFFSLGYLISIRLDLLEPFVIMLLLMGLLALRLDHIYAAIFIFMLSLFAKELSAVAIFSLIIHYGFIKNWHRVLLLLSAFLPYLGWVTYLAFKFGFPEAAVEKSSLLIIPFSGYFVIEDHASRWLIGLWVIAPAIFFGIWSFRELTVIYRTDEHDYYPLLVLGFAFLISVLPEATWIDPIAVFRWSLGLMLMLLLWGSKRHKRVLPYLAALWLPSGLIMFLVPGLI